jgi:carbohydrate diacid regulator
MTHNQIRKIAQKFPSFNKPCFVLAINCPSLKTGEVLNYLEQLALGGDDVVVQTEEDIIAYLCYLDGSKDYQSAMDFAQMLHDNIEEELSVSVKIGVGSRVKNAYELAGAFVLGDSAIKMGNIFGSKSSIFSYKEFIMMRMIEEIPEIVLKKYLDIFLDAGAKEILNDSEMLGTAEEFLANSLNLSETSRRLYMHRNTLMYRLDKIEKVMGLNIRRFSDAVTFRIILILYKHLKY